jgi:drug/metabolite transporter (DMT)-like permease
MDTHVLLMVLGAAVLHASWNALVKSGGNPWFRMGVVMGVSGLIGLIFIPFVPAPSNDVWPLLLLSAFIHQIYFCGVCMGYRIGDLSHVYPLQRGIAPVLVAIGAFIFMGERLGTQGLIGVGLICAAIFSLALLNDKHTTNRKVLLFALFTGTNIAIYSVIDGMAARLSDNVFVYIIWLTFISGIPFGLLAITITWKKGWVNVRQHMTKGLVGGTFTCIAYGLAIWAMSLAPVTYVSALRETSVIFAALIGSRILGEPFGKARIIAAGVVALGVVILHTGDAV